VESCQLSTVLTSIDCCFGDCRISTFANALRIVDREVEIFAHGEGHMLDVFRRCPSRERQALLQRLSDNVLVSLRREMPLVSDRIRVIWRDLVMDPVAEKIDRII